MKHLLLLYSDFSGTSSCLYTLFPHTGSVSSWTNTGGPGTEERDRRRPGVATEDILGAGISSRECHGVSKGGLGVGHFAGQPHNADLPDIAHGSAGVHQQHRLHYCVPGKAIWHQCDIMRLGSGRRSQEHRQRDG